MEYLAELLAQYGITTGQQIAAGAALWLLVYYLLHTWALRRALIYLTIAALAVFVLMNGGEKVRLGAIAPSLFILAFRAISR